MIGDARLNASDLAALAGVHKSNKNAVSRQIIVSEQTLPMAWNKAPQQSAAPKMQLCILCVTPRLTSPLMSLSNMFELLRSQS
jgi:hypothetical protein